MENLTQEEVPTVHLGYPCGFEIPSHTHSNHSFISNVKNQAHHFLGNLEHPLGYILSFAKSYPV